MRKFFEDLLPRFLPALLPFANDLASDETVLEYAVEQLRRLERQQRAATLFQGPVQRKIERFWEADSHSDGHDGTAGASSAGEDVVTRASRKPRQPDPPECWHCSETWKVQQSGTTSAWGFFQPKENGGIEGWAAQVASARLLKKSLVVFSSRCLTFSRIAHTFSEANTFSRRCPFSCPECAIGLPVP